MLSLCLMIFLVNILLKSLFLTSISPVITYDEMYYLGEAQSIVTSATDTTGSWRPWYLAPAHSMYDELTGTTQALGFLLFPYNSFFSFRCIPIVMGSLLPVLLGLIAYRPFNRKLVFVLTALIATTNPWIFQFSKMGFDSLFSIFFYNLGIVLLLYLRGWRKLWALLSFFWGFFQYQGHKPLLGPWFYCV